ncbi:MAG: DNA polymerase I [Phycisphaerales bacterium]
MKTLYLIDGHAQFFRAFHAIRTPMTSPVTGEPTNMTFGFIGVLLKLLRERRPDYLAVVIDVSGDTETFRSALYPEYKATRPEPPETLGPQIERCLGVLGEIGVPVLGVEGFEADDVLATLVTQFADADDLAIRIVSKDKDLQQLLSGERVELYDPYNDERITEAMLKEEKGITPAQVIDLLALMGDNVDNVPGVPGIGPKTAAQLISEYGTIEAVIAEAEKPKGGIKGKRQENIVASKPVLDLSKQLVTLRHDVPARLELEDASVRDRVQLAKLVPLLRELGFSRYQQEVKDLLGDGAAIEEAPAPKAKREPSHGDFGGLFGSADGADGMGAAASLGTSTEAALYRCVRTRKELDELVAELKGAECIALDTETTSLSPMSAELCGLSFATKPKSGWYVPVRAPEGESHLDEATVLGALRPILEDPDTPKCGHNLKYDLLVLRNAGVRVRGVAFDSMIASYLIDASRSSHSMDALALALLGYTCTPISDLIGARSGGVQKTFDMVPLDRAAPYAAEDADVSLRLLAAMLPQLRAMKLGDLMDDLEMPLVEVLAELEWNGIVVDPDELDRQAARLNERIAALREQIEDAAPSPFNPDSPKQLSAVLFNKPDHAAMPGLGIKPLRKTKTGYSTDAEVLEKLASDPLIESPLPRLIVEHRQLTKLVSTYLVALKEAIHPRTKRVHASFNQTVAATGRLSSSDPNLQNIPIRTEVGREIRRAFVARPGCVLLAADYSQIELRLLAHLSRDPALIAAFRGGEDIHRAVAAEIHGVPIEAVTSEQRSGAKMVNFGIIYGVTAFGLGRRLGIDNSAAAEIIDAYKKRFAGITTFLQECIEQAKRHGYVETMMKRRRPITEIEARNPARRSLAERMAINSVVQGSAADLIKLAMVEIHGALTGADRMATVGGMKLAASAGPLPKALAARRDEVRMLLQIHDELVFEVPEDLVEPAQRWIVERMEGAMALDVPLVVDSSFGRSWFEGK